MTRCKAGDLAVIVFCPIGTEHLRGRVIKLTVRGPDMPEHPGYLGVDRTATWLYEGAPMKAASGYVVRFVNDCCLRPLRPGEGADETLTWAPRPERIEA